MIDSASPYLLQPDVALPAQYNRASFVQAQGERRLLLAMLEDAINCYRKNAFARDRRGQRLFHETREWMMSEDLQAFSFAYACDVLGVEPQAVRQSLEAWRSMPPRCRTERGEALPASLSR